MKIPQKKSKENKLSSIEKVTQFAKEYPMIYFIENNNFQADTIQKLRNLVSGKILFVKKKIFEKILEKNIENKKENLNDNENKNDGKNDNLNDDKNLNIDNEKSTNQFKIDKSYFLLFGSEKDQSILDSFEYPDFLKSGSKVDSKVVIPPGSIQNEKLVKFLPKLKEVGAKKILEEEFLVCSENEKLSENSEEILKILNKKLGVSKLNVLKKIYSEEIFTI